MALLIRHVQGRIMILVCSPSCNCTLLLYNKYYRTAPQDEAAGRTNQTCFVCYCQNLTSPAHCSAMSRFVCWRWGTLYINLTWVREGSWNRCAMPMSAGDKWVFGCYEWKILRLINQRIHWVICALNLVNKFRNASHYWHSSWHPNLDGVYSTMLLRIWTTFLARMLHLFHDD